MHSHIYTHASTTTKKKKKKRMGGVQRVCFASGLLHPIFYNLEKEEEEEKDLALVVNVFREVG